MKLYTEEQIREVCMSIDTNFYISDLYIDTQIKLLTHIELPSEEEIDDKAKDIYPINVGGDMWMANRGEVNKGYKQDGFTEGAKWVIEQIKQQDK